MQYIDFTVRISPGGRDRRDVSASSELGEAHAEFRFPFAFDDLDDVVRSVSRSVRGATATRDFARANPVVRAHHSPRDVGVALFNALFQGEVRSALDRCLAVARDRRETGVRIRLSMDLAGEGMAAVASLPWELMTPGSSEIPLVMSKQTVLVRSPHVLHRVDALPYEPPLRILAVMSNPKGTEPLLLEEERKRIESNWGLLPGVDVEFARPVFRDLLDRVAIKDYHVFHYMGHGDFDPDTGVGTLLLENEDGTIDRADGERLRVLLGDEPTLRLVFLNACRTGTAADGPGFDPFAGIATSLLKVGVPAVLAMQFPISDGAAIDFADIFYRRIAGGFPVDAAVTEARKFLFGGERSEWATPVLFMRSRDGVVFGRGSDGPTASPATQTSTADEPAMPVGSTDEEDPWASAPQHAFRIFLSAPNEDEGPTYRQLREKLERESGIHVVTDVPPPFPAAEHDAAVRRVVRDADLCVHVLGARAGGAIDGAESGRTYPVEQVNIGLELARSQLVLVPDHFDIDKLDDPAYHTFMRSLVDRPRDASRFELVRKGRHEMLGEILRKRRAIEDRRNQAESVSSNATAMLEVHRNDSRQAGRLIAHLVDHGLDPDFETSDDAKLASNGEELDRFERKVRECTLFLVVFGSAPRQWVKARLSRAVQVVDALDLTTRIGVYLAPPEKQADEVRFPPFYDLIPAMSGFDGNAVDALLAQVRRG